MKVPFPHSSGLIQQVHIVFDKYSKDSIKAQTRARKGEGQGHVYHVNGDALIPQSWKQFLTHGENKVNLAWYYTEYITENAPGMLKEQTIFVSGGQED